MECGWGAAPHVWSRSLKVRFGVDTLRGLSYLSRFHGDIGARWRPAHFAPSRWGELLSCLQQQESNQRNAARLACSFLRFSPQAGRRELAALKQARRLIPPETAMLGQANGSNQMR